jgi:SAM-dependent methyltransferase
MLAVKVPVGPIGFSVEIGGDQLAAATARSGGRAMLTIEMSIAHGGNCVQPTRRDYDQDPGRFRAGARLTAGHLEPGVSLYATVAAVLREHGARRTVDIGCGEGALRAAGVDGWLVGVDASSALLWDVAPPVVQADATALPFASASFDAAVAVNVLDHLTDPMVALREARRVIGTGGLLVAGAISRRDSPELASVWRPEPTPFDSEDAPQLVGEVFDRVQVRPWDARLVTLPDRAAVCDYLTARFVPRERAVVLARRVSTPVRVTKRGALVIGLVLGNGTQASG